MLEVLSGDPVRGSAVLSGRSVAVADVRLLAPVEPGKIVAVGRNYADHVAERHRETPTMPPWSNTTARG